MAVGLPLLALCAAACGGNRPVSRGYASRQLLPIRDSTLYFDSTPGPGTVIFQTGGLAPVDANYWLLNLSTGAVQDFGAMYPGAPTPATTPTQPYVCKLELPDGGGTSNAITLGIVDSATGVETDIANVISYAQCPGADGTLTAFVVDAAGEILLSVGPFTDLQPVPLALAVAEVYYWQFDPSNDVLAAGVLGGLPSAPAQLGFYSIDLGSYAITTKIPPVPASVAWASGATPAGSLQSTSVTGSELSIVSLGDHYVYPRVMSDGGTTMFAGPYASGAVSELALFNVPAGEAVPTPEEAVTSVSATGVIQYPSLVSWQLDGGSGAASELMIWDDANSQVVACPSAPQAYLAGIRSPDGTEALFVTPQQTASYQGSGPLLLLASAPGGSDRCTSLASANVVTADFSPDGTSMFWLAQPPTGEPQLWAAASDGSGARMIGTGVLQYVHFLAPGGAQLEMILDGDLVWLDLHDSTVTLHYVAEQVFDEIYDIRGGWLIAGYDYSSQDTNGTLGLVNRMTGEKRPISLEVAQFTVLAEGISSDGGFVDRGSDASVSSELSVVYQVHGRNPSTQDGIWLATITAADLQ
ncbi:MAG TPA: hypothetical protein VH853_24900 [Polyangia bacterium]|nr:hypothetical protein [Polyangia bacterium]